MASGEKNKYSRCSPCLDDGRNIVARHYCVECELYFCTKCVKCHNIIPVLKKHQVNDVNSSGSTNVDNETTERGSESVQSLRCTLHQGKLIDTYCKEHDDVSCGACVVVKHRRCTTLSIAIAAKDFKCNPEGNQYKEALTENLIQLKQEKEKRTENLDAIGKQKQEWIEAIDKYEEANMEKIKQLANNTRKDIRSKYEEYKTELDNDVEVLNGVITTTTDYVKLLEQTDGEQQFAYVKTNKTVTKDGAMLIQAMTTDWRKREIKFDFDDTLENQLLGMKTLGRLDKCDEYNEDCVVSEYKAIFHSNTYVNQSGDSDSSIFDICVMDSNGILLTDHQNMKLKRFNSDFYLKEEILLSGHPVAACKIDQHEVAVRMWSTKVVQIVSVGQSMQLTSSFTLADNGYGMTYDAGTREIFACENNKVSVYSKTGHELRTYDKDTNGVNIFSQCRQIVLSMNKQDIYVTNYNKGLVVLDKSGTLKMKVSLTDVSDPWPLCLLPGHIFLAGGPSSGVIVQIDKDGKQVGKLIDSKDGRTNTYCAVYDPEHSRLIVGGYPNVISIYTISAKWK